MLRKERTCEKERGMEFKFHAGSGEPAVVEGGVNDLESRVEEGGVNDSDWGESRVGRLEVEEVSKD